MAGWGTLLLYAGVFALITILIYAACMAMIRLEERRTAEKGPRL
jgi:hypothetical protein